jgi:hypothetical protein
MPLNALKNVEPLLEHIIKSLRPVEFIGQVARVDRPGYFRNFKGYRIENFGRPKIEAIARKELFTKENEAWAQLLIIMWNEANRKVYEAMHKQVQTLNEDVEDVEAIADEDANKFVDALLEDFVLEDIVIVTHLNDVRFSDAFIRERLEAPLDIDRPVVEKSDEPEHVHGPDCNHE